MLKIAEERRCLTFPGEMRQGPILEPIRDSLPADGLLTHAGYHLRDVDERTLWAAESHDEGAVGAMELFLARFPRRLTDDRQLAENDWLWGQGRRGREKDLMKLDTAEAVLTLVVGINALMSPQAPVFPMKEAQFLPIHISNWINLDCCFSVMCINVASESSEYIQTFSW